MGRRRARVTAGVAALGCLAVWLLVAPSAFATSAWLAPVGLTQPRDESGRPQVAVDARGDTTAVWFLREAGGNTVIQAATRPAGGSWQAPVDISESGAAPFFGTPQLAVDPRGDAIAVWSIGSVFRNKVIQSAYKPAAGSWQAAVSVSEVQEEVSPPSLHEAYEPQVAFDSHGDAVAVWTSGLVAGQQELVEVIQSAYRPAGGAWQAPVNLTEPNGEARAPQVAVDAQGDAVAAWEARRQNRAECFGERIVQASSRLADGTWQAPVDVSGTSYGCDSEEPKLAIDSRGDAVAVWIRFGRVEGEATRWLQAASMPSRGQWQAPVNLSPLGGGAGASEPEVAIDPHGDATAVWDGFSRESEGVASSTMPAGGTWQAPVSVSGPAQITEPDVALDESGDAVAVWGRYGTPNKLVQGAIRPAGGAWRPPVTVSEANQDTRKPLVASDPSGNAVAVWMRSSKSGEFDTEIVQAAGYDGAGPELNDLTIPSSVTAGEPLSLSVSPLSVWSTVAKTTWSFGDGSSATGTSVTHTYAKARTYEVTIESEDVLGNKTSISSTITIAPRPRPTITRVEPDDGRPPGGTVVTITGAGFAGAAEVDFGARVARSFTVNSATSITAISPKGHGTVDVTVTTLGGTSAISAADQFAYGHAHA